MAGQTVYIVRGSEDGNLAVYTNAQRAAQRATAYCGGEGTTVYRYGHMVPATDREVCRSIRLHARTQLEGVESDGYKVTATIESKRLNQD